MCTDVPLPDIAELARVGLGVGDELGRRPHRQRRRHHHDVGEPHHAGNRRAVAQEYERKILVERLPDRVVGRDEHDGVAVGGGIDHRIGRDHAAGADPVLDHELLTEMVRQPLPEHARHDVVRPPGGEADHKVNGLAGIFVGGGGRYGQAKEAQHQCQGANRTRHGSLHGLEPAEYTAVSEAVTGRFGDAAWADKADVRTTAR
jgi:hypothetical protein